MRLAAPCPLSAAPKTEGFFAYRITNNENGKNYIGITRNNVRRRALAHLSAAHRGVDFPLYRSIRNRGDAAFSIEVIAEAFSADELMVLERGLIAEHGTMVGAGGYNLTAGGEGLLGVKRPPEFGQTISAALTGIKRSEETKAKLRGRRLTNETRKKMSEAAKRRDPCVWQANLAKAQSAPRTPMSAEARARVSAAASERQTGRVLPPEHVAKVAAANTGKRRTPEQRARMSAAQYARWDRERMAA